MSLALAGGLWVPRFATAGQAVEEPPKKPEEQLRMPQTPAEHFARAATYEAKAKGYRQEAQLHRRMLDDYLKRALPPRDRTGRELPWAAKMRRHCEGYIQKAEALAKEADGFAAYHRMRGKEMQGQ